MIRSWGFSLIANWRWWSWAVAAAAAVEVSIIWHSFGKNWATFRLWISYGRSFAWMVSFSMLCGWGIGFRFLVPSFMKLKEREREREREMGVCVCTCFGNREECWRDIVLALPSWMLLLSFQPFQPLLASAASWHTDRQSELAKHHHHYCCCCSTKASSTPLLFPTIFFLILIQALASRMGVSLEELEPKQEPEKKRGRECICEYPNNCTKKNLWPSCYWCWMLWFPSFFPLQIFARIAIAPNWTSLLFSCKQVPIYLCAAMRTRVASRASSPRKSQRLPGKKQTDPTTRDLHGTHNTKTHTHTNPERKSKSLQLLPAVSKHSWLLNTNFLLLLLLFLEASSSSSWQRETEAFSFFLSQLVQSGQLVSSSSSAKMN